MFVVGEGLVPSPIFLLLLFFFNYERLPRVGTCECLLFFGVCACERTHVLHKADSVWLSSFRLPCLLELRDWEQTQLPIT
jgi:hypothetical protein